MKYALIQRKWGGLPVKRACQVLRVSASGYYTWQQRGTIPKSGAEVERFVAQIITVFEESRRTYGSPRVTAALRQQGIVGNRKRVARLIQKYDLVAKHRRQHRVRTTDSRHGLPVAPNRLNRDFSAERPNEKWVADITSIDTTEGWLSLALVLDVFSRRIVAWAMDVQRETDNTAHRVRSFSAGRKH